MAELPKIVRQRLVGPGSGTASTAAVQAHPDADLLTGFLERSLTSAEQQDVMQHLAQCAECRDIAVTALPEAEAAQPVLAPVPQRTGWRGLALLRWGAMAAALVIAVGTVVMYRGEDNEGPTRAVAIQRSAAPVTPTAPAAEAKPAVAADQSATTSSDVKSPSSAEQPAAEKKQPFEMRTEDASAGANIGARRDSDGASLPGPAKAARARKNEVAPVVTLNNLQMASTNSRPDAASGSGFAPFGRIAAGPVLADKQEVAPAEASAANRAANANEPIGQPSRPVSEASLTPWGRTLKRNPGVTTATENIEGESSADTTTPAPTTLGTTLGGTSNRSGGRFGNLSPRILFPNMANSMLGNDTARRMSTPVSRTQWTTADGRVVRSNDGGANWKSVDVGEGVTFHAIAHSGNQIWAGGSGGALFHSSDDGATWHRDPVSAGERSPKGDIISIDFQGRQGLGVVTSAGEIWSSSDHGQHWDVQ
jgi:hypothetical protein